MEESFPTLVEAAATTSGAARGMDLLGDDELVDGAEAVVTTCYQDAGDDRDEDTVHTRGAA